MFISLSARTSDYADVNVSDYGQLQTMIFVYVILLCWIILIALDFGLKVFLKGVYTRFLSRRGITLNPFQVKILSTRTNNFWSRLAFKYPRFWSVWFNIGTLTCFLVIPISMVILSNNLISYVLSASSGSASEGQALQPIVPGINVPWKDAGYYILSLTLASIVHEAGHALAAASVNVQIDGAGLMLFILVPAAFVELPTGVYEGLSPRNQLKVVCAGVWHNLVLVLISASLILAAPVILYPVYTPTDGVLIARITNSDLSGRSGLQVNDVIKSIDGCKVTDKQDWKRCLIRSITNFPVGFCVTSQFIEEERYFSLDPDTDCCGDDNKRNLCFESGIGNKFCFPARTLIKQFGNKNCSGMNDTTCSPDRCFRPYASNNLTKLLVIERENQDEFLFWGFPGELYSQVTVTKFKPRFSWIPAILIHLIDSFLRYTISFSLALGALNVVPCFYLDGQWITKASIDLFFNNRLNIDRRNFVTNSITFFGSILVLTSIMIALTSLATILYK